jgi:hypothetical protein
VAAGVPRCEDGLLARQVRRQRLAPGHPIRRGGGTGRRHGLAGLGRRGLLVFQPELELVEALGGRPEPMATEAGELVLELGDPQGLGLHQRDQAFGDLAQFGRVFGQRLGLVEHDR